MPTPLVLERLDLGQTPGNLRGTQLRPGGAIQNRNADKIEAAVNALSGLTIVAGPVTKLAPGANPTANLSGAAPNYTLNLGLPEGAAGAGAPSSADILAIAEKGRLERALATAGVPDEPSLILDFMRGVHFARNTAIAASIPTLIAALGGSSFARASTATYIDSDGLLKAAANNVPRIDCDPATGARMGLLIEAQARTNSNTYSDDLTHSSYSLARLAVTANAGDGPAGLSTMELLTEDTTVGNSHYIYRNIGIGSGNASEQCFSVFVRANGRSRVRLYMTDFDTLGRVVSCDFNLVAGTFAFNGAVGGAVNGSAGIKDFGFGLYRIWMTGTLGGGTSTQPRIYLLDNTGAAVYTGDGASGVYSGAWQLEIGPAPSSLIYTTASAAARAADAFSLSPSAWVNFSELTLLAEFITTDVSAAVATIAELSNGTYNNRTLVHLSTNSARGSVVSGGAAVAAIPGGAYAAGSIGRLAFAAKLDDFAVSYNGAAVVSDITGAMPISNPTTLTVGYQGGGGGGFMGHIRRLLFFPQRLSNAKLQALSNQGWS